jgi:hypothetical protein
MFTIDLKKELRTHNQTEKHGQANMYDEKSKPANVMNLIRVMMPFAIDHNTKLEKRLI